MESLALIASVIAVAVFVSGPLAFVLLLYDYPYLGGTLGAIAVPLGVWWAWTMRGHVGWFGVLSAALGLWTVVQAWSH